MNNLLESIFTVPCIPVTSPASVAVASYFVRIFGNTIVTVFRKKPLRRALKKQAIKITQAYPLSTSCGGSLKEVIGNTCFIDDDDIDNVCPSQNEMTILNVTKIKVVTS